jgi:hypothetical protein
MLYVLRIKLNRKFQLKDGRKGRLKSSNEWTDGLMYEFIKIRLMEVIYEERSCRCLFHYMDLFGLEPGGPTTSPAMRSCDKLEVANNFEYILH